MAGAAERKLRSDSVDLGLHGAAQNAPNPEGVWPAIKADDFKDVIHHPKKPCVKDSM